MKRFNIFSLLVLVLPAAVLWSSCKKFVEVDPPKNMLITSTVFTNDASAVSAISGIYSSMVNSSNFFGGGNTGMANLTGLSSDELVNFSSDVNRSQFYKNGLAATNTVLNTSVWTKAYQLIYACNAFLEGINASTTVTAPMKKQLEAEAKFVRAYCNFYLVNLFGDIPVVTGTDYKVNGVVTRETAANVYTRIIQDLKDAQADLATDYSYSLGEKTRPNQWAATAMLARVYLYTGDWADAATAASAVINGTPDIFLETDLNNVFFPNSTEAIWQMTPNQNYTNDGAFFIILGTPRNSAMSDQLDSAFEPGDARLVNWVGVKNATIGGNPVTVFFPYKYKVNFSEEPSEYTMVLRLGEQYLILAEAMAQQDDITGAQQNLDVIRMRAGLPGTTANDKTSMLAAIAHERRVELFAEGHRWFDLKRTGEVDNVMSTVTPLKGGSWSGDWQLWPIPSIQLLNDPNMSNAQNPGY